MNKVIYTDVDGVLVNWVSDFYRWVFDTHRLPMVRPQNVWSVAKVLAITETRAEELVDQFNNTPAASSLAPLRDSVKYINKFNEQGYSFIAITQFPFGNANNRNKNLFGLFGMAVKKILYVTASEDKTKFLQDCYNTEKALLPFVSSPFWIEDSGKTSKIGKDIGFDSILMTHSYNKNDPEDWYDKRVNNWKEIYDYIIG